MTKKKQLPFDDQVRKMPAHERGYRAFHDGISSNSCPFPRGDQRMAWFTGWYDARMQDTLGHIFDKYGLTWP